MQEQQAEPSAPDRITPIATSRPASFAERAHPDAGREREADHPQIGEMPSSTAPVAPVKLDVRQRMAGEGLPAQQEVADVPASTATIPDAAKALIMKSYSNIVRMPG